MNYPNRLPIQWRRWLIECLLAGVRPRDLEAAMSEAGLGVARAKAAIQAEVDRPIFRGSYRAACMQRKLEGLMGAYGRLHRRAPDHQRVDRRDAPSLRDIRAALSLRSRPLIARDALPALAEQGLSLRSPRIGFGVRKRLEPLQPARTDLLLYQVLGRRRMQLVPWYEYLAVVTRSGAPPPLQLEATVEAGEALQVPVGWWYRSLDRDGGVAVTFDIAGAVTWRRDRFIRTAARPPPSARPDPSAA